jgi:hypothetical protein
MEWPSAPRTILGVKLFEVLRWTGEASSEVDGSEELEIGCAGVVETLALVFTTTPKFDKLRNEGVLVLPSLNSLPTLETVADDLVATELTGGLSMRGELVVDTREVEARLAADAVRGDEKSNACWRFNTSSNRFADEPDLLELDGERTGRLLDIFTQCTGAPQVVKRCEELATMWQRHQLQFEARSSDRVYGCNVSSLSL